MDLQRVGYDQATFTFIFLLNIALIVAFLEYKGPNQFLIF